METVTPKHKVVAQFMEIRVPMAELQYTTEEKLQEVLTHLVILKVLGVLMNKMTRTNLSDQVANTTVKTNTIPPQEITVVIT